MTRLRALPVLSAIALTLALGACSSGGTDTPAPGGETPPPAPETIESACPEGFVEAYLAENAEYYQPGLTITEIPATDFRPAVLAPFFNGGCAIRLVGTSLRGTVNDRDEGFAVSQNPDAIGEALVAEGYEESSNTLGRSFDIVEDQRIVIGVSYYDVASAAGTAVMKEFFADGTLYVLVQGEV